MLTIDVIWIAGIIGAIAVIAGTFYKVSAPITNALKGIKSLLRYRLHRECIIVLSEGWITSQQIEDLTDLYESYKNLGGNGAVAKLYLDAIACHRISESEAEKRKAADCYYLMAQMEQKTQEKEMS